MLLFTVLSLALSVSAAVIPVTSFPYSPDNINPDTLTGGLTGTTLISPNVLANVLSPADCPVNKMVGVWAPRLGGDLASRCECVQVGVPNDVQRVIGALLPGESTACPACPTNAHRICRNSTCGCECATGFYATTIDGPAECAPVSKCRWPRELVAGLNGQSTCE